MSELLKVLALLGYVCVNPNVSEEPGLKHHGFYHNEAGINYIALRSGLDQERRERALIHELIHCGIHTSGRQLSWIAEEMEATRMDMVVQAAMEARAEVVCSGDCGEKR